MSEPVPVNVPPWFEAYEESMERVRVLALVISAYWSASLPPLPLEHEPDGC